MPRESLPVEGAFVKGRLPGEAWVEIEKPPKNCLQALEHRNMKHTGLYLYAQKTQEDVQSFLEGFSRNLKKLGYTITVREELFLKNGTWHNFIAEKPGVISRVYAKKEGGVLLWVLFSSADATSYALLHRDVERYLSNLRYER
ncbi:MAG: hypothetical protein NZM25_00595 [Leptospiraceae bacterium]|nr:hypothetical protein [Leptospiraceae bacterium]